MALLDPMVVAIGFLLAGVVASFVPVVPGGLLSVTGIGYYWYMTGEPGILALSGLFILGGVAVIVDWLGSAISARVGGAALQTTAIAAVVAVILLVFSGPIGALLGIAGTVFLLEYRRHGDVSRGVRTALYATIGMLASTAMQVVLTGMLLIAFIITILV